MRLLLPPHSPRPLLHALALVSVADLRELTSVAGLQSHVTESDSIQLMSKSTKEDGSEGSHTDKRADTDADIDTRVDTQFIRAKMIPTTSL